jgi:hypothetical protein
MRSFLLWAISLVSIAGIIGYWSLAIAPDIPAPPLSAAEQEARKISEIQSKRTGQAMETIAELRRHLRNPDSLVLESARANTNGSIVYITYRAQNGFGGMNKEFVLSTTTRVSQDPADWKKHCSRPMLDILGDIKYEQEPKWYKTTPR